MGTPLLILVLLGCVPLGVLCQSLNGTATSTPASSAPSSAPSTTASASQTSTEGRRETPTEAGEVRPAFQACLAGGGTDLPACARQAYSDTGNPFNKCTNRDAGCWVLDDVNLLPDRTGVEYEGYDGFYNNFAHPELGAIDSPLVRVLPPAYSDGVYQPRRGPNPFQISDATMSGFTGQPSLRNRTALLVFFGQQVVEEVLDAQRPGCPPEYINIDIPPGHEFSHNLSDFQMPFLRSRYSMRTGFSPNNPRQQLNEITAYIDGSLMYGVAKAWADALREFKGGRLKASSLSNNMDIKY